MNPDSSEPTHAGDQFRLLLDEMNTIMDLTAVEEISERQSWVLVTKDETVLDLDYEDQGGVVIVSCNLGSTVMNDPSRLYQMLLVYNGQWRQTGGVTLSLDSPDGPVRMALAIGVADLTPQRVAEVLTSFLSIRDGWVNILEKSSDPDQIVESEDSIPEHAIRG